MDGRASSGALGVAAGVFAVLCCAGLPAIGGLIGGATIAGVIGVGAAVLAITALLGGAALAVRARRRRGACPPSARGRVR
jgi:hypothetical protein